MKRNRLILCGAIIASGTFASFFGGNISHALFYITLIIPVMSLIYTFYVFCRFKIYQKIEQRKVLKGELTPYEFTLSNEDVISYPNIRVNFFTDKSYVSNAQGETEYMLIPGESNTLKTTLCCKYRGEYDVGAKSVVITDYLYLFSITYPILTKLNLIVLPRVFTIERLKLSLDEQDPKKTKYTAISKEQLDIDVRKYVSGDSKKLIHWKASARNNELLVRKYTDNPRTRILLIMDLAAVNENPLDKIIIEDKIIESALAIANYYKNNNTNIVVCYDNFEIKEENINNIIDFEVFYNNCTYLHFNARNKVQDILIKQLTGMSESFFGIIITHSLTNELFEISIEALSRGAVLTLLFISDDTSDRTKQIIRSFNTAGIMILRINIGDNIVDVLSA